MSSTLPVRTPEEMAAAFAAGLATGVGKSLKHESADKHVSGEALPCDSLSKCTAANKHAKSCESDFLAGMRERYIQRLGIATQATPKVIGWKERLGSLFTAA